MTAVIVLAAVLFAALAFGAGTAYSRLREEDDDAVDAAELPDRIGRPAFTGLHTPPSRYATGHPPEPGRPPAP
jgi:hypothetical protein